MTDCILWAGARDRNGYGAFDNKYAHRLAYIEAHGSIPEGMQVDHVCHSLDASCAGGATCLHRACVNPDHLEAVTQAENIRRGRSVSNLKAAQTHCIHGHEFTPENIYRRKNGTRNCRECRRRVLREFYARHKESA